MLGSHDFVQDGYRHHMSQTIQPSSSRRIPILWPGGRRVRCVHTSYSTKSAPPGEDEAHSELVESWDSNQASPNPGSAVPGDRGGPANPTDPIRVWLPLGVVPGELLEDLLE